MLIKKNGIFRETTKEKFNLTFKDKGFKVVEKDEVKVVEVEDKLEDKTNAELKELLQAEDKPIYGNKSELIERLRE